MTAAPSYVHGAAHLPLLGETIGAAFDRTVARHGDAHALVGAAAAGALELP